MPRTPAPESRLTAAPKTKPTPATSGPARPVFARHAASLIVLRGESEVLMGMRGAGHRFMPNRLVFPGGSVDPGDGARPAATEPRPDVLAALGRAARPRLARALVAAAVRELEEETGLSLGDPSRLDGIGYLCRAVTPPASPMRFNARFLMVDAAQATGTIGGSGELEGLRYYPMDEALALDLALVTREVLLRLQAWQALGAAGQAARMATGVFKQRRWWTE
jgi:8-oxo-dGTP pyrophosphatase MutT (NUDIX family)